MNDYWSKLFTDPSFMGALLGALITGVIAIYIMNRNIVYNRKQEKKKVLNEFLKESSFLLYSIKNLIALTNTYVKYQKEEELITNRIDQYGFPTIEMNDITHAKRLNKTDIDESLRKIKSVNRNAFTRDSFDLYLNILSVVEGDIEYFWKRSLAHAVNGVGEILEEANGELNVLKSFLEKKYVEKEEEYNSL